MIGSTLHTLRKKKGVSQDRLASFLKVSQQTVSAWEKDTAEPDIASLRALADFFGVSVDYLVGHVTPQPEDDNARMRKLLDSLTPEQVSLLCVIASKALEDKGET